MKIACRVHVDLVRDAGARPDNPEKTPEQIVAEWCARSPDLRPCGLMHQWVDKRYCVKRCPNFKRSVEE